MTHPIRRRLFLSLMLFVLVPFAEVEAVAAEEGVVAVEDQAVGNHYNGSFVEYGARGGATFGSDYSGWSLDAGLRHSFPMLLGDSRLAYRFDSLTNDESEIDLHSAGLTLSVHPFYLALLASGWKSFVISSFALELGVGVQYASYESIQDAEVSDSQIGFVWNLGAGLDIPLWNPNRGQAPWLNIVYRYQRSRLDLAHEDFGLGLHTVFAGLGWRVNGVIF